MNRVTTLALALFLAATSAQAGGVRAVMEGLPTTNNVLLVSTTTKAVLMGTTYYAGLDRNLGLAVASDVVVGADAVTLSTSGAITAKTLTVSSLTLNGPLALTAGMSAPYFTATATAVPSSFYSLTVSSGLTVTSALTVSSTTQFSGTVRVGVGVILSTSGSVTAPTVTATTMTASAIVASTITVGSISASTFTFNQLQVVGGFSAAYFTATTTTTASSFYSAKISSGLTVSSGAVFSSAFTVQSSSQEIVLSTTTSAKSLDISTAGVVTFAAPLFNSTFTTTGSATILNAALGVCYSTVTFVVDATLPLLGWVNASLSNSAGAGAGCTVGYELDSGPAVMVQNVVASSSEQNNFSAIYMIAPVAPGKHTLCFTASFNGGTQCDWVSNLNQYGVMEIK